MPSSRAKSSDPGEGTLALALRVASTSLAMPLFDFPSQGSGMRIPETGGGVAIRMISRKFFSMPERIQKPVEPAPWGPKQGDGDGPRSPDISRPDTKDLLKKMRKVDPNQSKRYRQRTGQ